MSSKSSSSSSKSFLEEEPVRCGSISPVSSSFRLSTSSISSSYHFRSIFENPGPVFSLCATGNQLLSGSQDKNQILLWRHDENSEVLNQVDKFARGDGSVKALLQVTHRGNPLILSAHQDNKIRVWMKPLQSNTYKLSATLPTARDIAINCVLPRNYVKVRRHRKCLWLQHSDTISSLATDGSLVFSSSWDRTVKVWKLSTLRCLTSFRAHDDAINTVAVSGDGFLYTGSADSTIKVWRKSSNNQLHKFTLVSTLKNHHGSVNALAVAGSNQRVYSAMSDSTIAVWERCEPDHMKLAESLRGHRQAVLCLALTQQLLCSGSADASVRLWSCKSEQHHCLGVLLGHIGPVKSITVAEEQHQELGKDQQNVFRVYSGGLDKQIIVWRICTNTLIE